MLALALAIFHAQRKVPKTIKLTTMPKNGPRVSLIGGATMTLTVTLSAITGGGRKRSRSIGSKLLIIKI